MKTLSSFRRFSSYQHFVLRAREPVSSYTHYLGAVASAMVSLFLALQAVLCGASGLEIMAVGLFGLSMTLLYTASSVYHFYAGGARTLRRLRKLDHSMIFVMIAGAYTPFFLFVLGGDAVGFLLLLWLLALGGIGLKMLWINQPSWVSAVLYLAMGWMIVLRPEVLHGMPVATIVLMAAGGVAYSIGAVIYALKKPDLRAPWGFHEVFHVFILLGSLLQTIAIVILIGALAG